MPNVHAGLADPLTKRGKSAGRLHRPKESPVARFLLQFRAHGAKYRRAILGCQLQPDHTGRIVMYGWPMDFDEFGPRMKQARLAAGKTQQQIADAIGKTKAAVSNFEKNHNLPSLETVMAFAQETKVSLDWLLLGKQPEGEFDQRIRALPEALKEYVISSLLLAERVQLSIPARFLRPPTTESYVEFSAYLQRLSEEMSSAK